MTGQTFFEDIKKILQINQILEKCYQFLAENFPEVKMIDCTGDNLYFTDKAYEYGAVPSHLNDVINRKIAGKIEVELQGLR